jgi:pyridoxine 5'-phosphate synthase PdxJ
MPHSEAVNWQPISEMPLIASMIDEALDDTRAHIKTLTEASVRPHVMDDATVNRIDRVHAEQMEFVDIYAEQIGRWRNERPSVRQTRELDRMEEQNRQLRDATTTVLALSHELRKGTIERVMEKSDIELGLEAVLRGRPAARR